MKRTVSIDDIDGTSVADLTTYLGRDGEWRELDLTGDHGKQLDILLQEYWNAGRKVTSVPRKREYRPQERHGMTSREYWAGFRTWCQQNGRTFTTSSGKFYPARGDVTDFDDHLSARDAAALP
jgi:hypothetical protein